MVYKRPAFAGNVSDALLARRRVDPARIARVAVAATFFCHGLYFAGWAAHIPHVKAALGLSAGELGLVLLAAPLGVVSAMVVAARLLPRWGAGVRSGAACSGIAWPACSSGSLRPRRFCSARCSCGAR